MVEGRDFSKDFPTDSVGYIINETALKITGYKDPDRKTIYILGQERNDHWRAKRFSFQFGAYAHQSIGG